MTQYTLAALAERFQLTLSDSAAAQTAVTGLAPLPAAEPQHISFFTNPSYREQLKHTRAAAVIIRPDHQALCSVPCLLSNNPYASFAELTALFDSTPQVPAGIHSTAVVAESARVAASAAIGPHAVIGEYAVIGERTQINSGVNVGAFSVVGDDCDLRANVVLGHSVSLGNRVRVHAGSSIGADGFGFAPAFSGENPGWRKIYQLGGVIIGDDVEVGANTCIDRGALGDTEIGRGVIIDNLVQIAHNVKIGEYTAIAACTGIAGSTEIGAYCTIAGAVGIVGHIKIADRVHITAKSLVTGSITEAGSYSSGTALMPTKAWRKSAVRFTQLDKLFRR